MIKTQEETMIKTQGIKTALAFSLASTVALAQDAGLDRAARLDRALTQYEEALRIYKSGPETAKRWEQMMQWFRPYAAEYKRFNTPPPQYDYPYKGILWIERLPDLETLTVKCKKPLMTIGCSAVAGDYSWCRVFIVADDYIAKMPIQPREAMGLSYESVLRHEIAHCNGWPGDHPR